MTNKVSQRDWADLYVRHLAEWDERLSAALDAAGLDTMIVFAGAEKTRFRDDLPYPYAVEPYFKAWVPLTDQPGSALRLTPGERPLLIDLREDGFWHEPPEELAGYWLEHFDIRQAASPAAVIKELGSVGSGVGAIGEPAGHTAIFSSVNDETLLSHLDYLRAY
ncbi:MAG: Xaa-Pro dipeptidase, partial [Gammaproteobacteria bacterium]